MGRFQGVREEVVEDLFEVARATKALSYARRSPPPRR